MRRETVRAELRDHVFRLFCGGGVLLGILWTANTWDLSPRDCPAEPDSTGLVTECVKQTFADVVYPGLAKIGIGLFAGAFLAVVICRTVPGLKRKRA